MAHDFWTDWCTTRAKRRRLHINSLFVREDLIDCWYDNDFIYSLEWNVIHTMAKDFEQYMGWQISEPLPPLYSEIIYVDFKD